MSETGPQPDQGVTDDQKLRDYDDLRSGRLPNTERTYLMAHAANAEEYIDPKVAAEGAGNLYDKGLTDIQYEQVKAGGLTPEQRQELSHELYPEGQFDALTGLSSRAMLDTARERAEQDPESAFVMFDLDKLKAANEGPGKHAAGDELLRNAARAVLGAAAQFGLTSRNVFRYGGDEFVAIVPREKATAFEALAKELYREYTTGIGSTLTEADHQMMERKEARPN